MIIICFTLYILWLLYLYYILIRFLPEELTDKICLGIRLIPWLLGALISWISCFGFREFYVQWNYNEDVYQIRFKALFFSNNDF